MAIGRPTTWDADKARRICKLVAGGMPMLYAAESVGVCEKTLYNWMNAQAGPPGLLQFLQDIKSARSKALAFRIKRIRKHGGDDWKADAWWCERMFADEFGTDKRLVKELLEELTAAKSELEAVRANLRRTAKRAKARRQRNKGTVRGDGDGV